ncbi:MAG TPA: ABC transporter permease [Candidatus Kapabacteria bacterium]|nr:ABC transporter permease [Candidatus Kapabacteria bacterium]
MRGIALDSNIKVKNDTPRSLWYYSWKRLKRNKLAMAGFYVTILIILVALFAGLLAPADPNLQILEYSTKSSGFRGNMLLRTNDIPGQGPVPIPIQSYEVKGNDVFYVSDEGNSLHIPISKLAGSSSSQWHVEPLYVLGTDRYGRDVLSRLIYGARVSLTVAFFSELLSIVVGVFLGALAGFYRGWVDEVINWLTNVFWSIPTILLVIAISIALGLGFIQTVVAIGITGWPDMTRIVRGQFFSLRETEYVEATRALGLGSLRTIFRHVLPNAIGPIIVIATAGFATAIIYEASLSFLGLGVQPPTSTWGQMIYDGYGYIAAGTNWGLTIFPALAIMLAVFAFNLFGDGLRDAFDPKLKR